MHLIRLDIDRKNSAAHLQCGPFGGGLNAVFAPLQGGSATMARFVRSILFRGKYVNEVFETEEGESIDGSMQWVDASGHVRMMSFAGGSAMIPGGFVNSPLHPSERPLHEQDADRIRGLGNIFWEGDEGDARWDELRGDILGMLFCSSLGSVSPEKLWWAASRLGVHAPARNVLDEGYQRLKAEERDLLDRLRNADAVDHDRAWWALERDRLLAEISHVDHANHHPSHPTERTQKAIVAGLRERLAAIQVELSTLKNAHQDLLVSEANSKLDSVAETVPTFDTFRDEDSQTTYVKSVRHERGSHADYSVELQRIRNRLDKLVAEKADVEYQLKNNHFVTSVETTRRWDDSQLRQQLSHAEEMLRRWDRRAQWHRRLAEVQSHLKTRSPYRRTSEGSLIPLAEKYLRELTAGAARQLPPWAVESSYLRGHDMPVDFDGMPVEYGTEFGARDTYYDRRLPSSDSRQRRLVDLAIRLAIAEKAVPRIGRIPFLFDNSIETFRGEALEQILHVLAGFARDGRQILLATHDEFVARRIAAHGGSVSRMHEILRYARPRYVMDSYDDLGLHPNIHTQPAIHVAGQYGHGADISAPRIAASAAMNSDVSDINRQLSGWANEQESNPWWGASNSNTFVTLEPSNAELRGPVVRPAPVGVRNSKFHLHLDSPVDMVPTVDPALAARFVQSGIHRVGDLLRSTPESLGAAMRVDEDLVYYLQCVAELMTATPQLRSFDARVLVGCGITRSHMLRDLDANQLISRVDNFLRSSAGQDLLRSAQPFEANRIREWLQSMRNPSSRSRTRYSERTQERTSDRGSRRDAVASAIRAYEPREMELRGYEADDSDFERDSYDREPRTTRTVRETRSTREAASSDRVSASGSVSEPRITRETRVVREPRSTTNGRSGTHTTVSTVTTQSQWKFYLDTESPVVDAPSIGPKMAGKLANASIVTVGDLLAASPEVLAEQLGERTVTAEVILEWQRQALFVCRVPNLRGHDAQLIVGSGLHSAEELAAASVEQLFEKVSQFASSKGGVRILRGSDAPDRQEVTDWIHWAQNCRAVRAA